MEIKSKIGLMLCLITLIASISFTIPITLSSPDTYGPRLDELYGHFVESPAAQRYELETGGVDFWPDIRDAEILRDLEEEGYEVVTTPEAFVFYHIDFNVRDQIGNGTHVQCKPPNATADPTWTLCPRGPTGTSAADKESKYYQYYGEAYKGYVPLDDEVFRHAVAHTRPLSEIVAVVYGGISGAAIDSLVPPAQKAWWNPDVDGHPLALGSPYATTVYNGTHYHDACSILRSGGYVWTNETGYNPAPKYADSDPDGCWLDPALGIAEDNLDTPWDDTEMMPMNHITFSGVTVQIAPDSFGRDDLCHRNMRAIGLPIEHVQEDYGHLTDVMMDYYQFDMYALGWQIGRFPSTLYGLHHSSQNFVPEGGNMEGVDDPELDGYLEIIQFNTDVAAVTQACYDAQDRLAELCMSIPTITRPLYVAGVVEGAPEGDPNPAPDTLLGIVNMPGFGSDTQWSFTGFHWESLVDPDTNPYGIGGRMDYIVPSEATNYHPGYASTTDEFLVLQNIYDNGAMEVNPYTHEDIPWLAEWWNVTDWTEPISGNPGMNISFLLRDDVYWHDGEKFDAYDAAFSLEFMKELQMANLFLTWQYLVDVEVQNSTFLSVYQNTTSLWILYFVAGGINLMPEHIYAGTDRFFRPEAKEHSYAIIGENVGTGDGSTTVFTLDNTPVIDDPDLREVIYFDGNASATTEYAIVYSTGTITFTTAPPSGVVITADYRQDGVEGLTCLIGTGPFVFISSGMVIGTYSKMLAYRTGVAPVTTNWWMTVEEFDILVGEMFHWIGDVSGQALGSPPDGEIGVYDLGNGGKCYGTYKGQAGYNENVDINPEPTYHENDDFIDIRDLAEISKNYGKKRDYPR